MIWSSSDLCECTHLPSDQHEIETEERMTCSNWLADTDRLRLKKPESVSQKAVRLFKSYPIGTLQLSHFQSKIEKLIVLQLLSFRSSEFLDNLLMCQVDETGRLRNF